MTKREEFALAAAMLFMFAFGLGLVVGRFVYDDSTTVDLAPNGMAYCPADSSTPHPTPCMFRQP